MRPDIDSFPRTSVVHCLISNREKVVYFLPGFSKSKKPIIRCNGCEDYNGSNECKRCISEQESKVNKELGLI